MTPTSTAVPSSDLLRGHADYERGAPYRPGEPAAWRRGWDLGCRNAELRGIAQLDAREVRGGGPLGRHER